MVNQSKNFPSFSDVLETVEKANNKYKLNLKYNKSIFFLLYFKINILGRKFKKLLLKNLLK
jgi:hypothetical protein